MAVTVKIPAQLRTLTGDEGETEVEGGSVGEALEALYERYDGLRDRITEDGELRRFVNVYVGGEDIRFGDGLETAVSDGDEITILPAVAGGAQPPRCPRPAQRGRPFRGAARACSAGARPHSRWRRTAPSGRSTVASATRSTCVRARAAVDRAGDLRERLLRVLVEPCDLC